MTTDSVNGGTKSVNSAARPTARSLRAKYRLAGIALASVLAVPGCAAGEAQEREHPPVVVESSSAETSGQQPRSPVAPPLSERDAFDAAAATAAAGEVRALEVARYGADYESLQEFGDWRGGMLWEGALDRSPDDVVVGVPDVWTFDYSLSSAASLTMGGKSYPFAVVRLVGCLQVGWVVEYANPQMQTEWKLGDSLPRSLIAQYDPERRNWFVTGSDDLAGVEGPPECD